MKFSFLFAAVGTCMLASAPARAEGPIIIKFSDVVTTGRVNVEVYASSMLYKDKEEPDALQLGAVQMRKQVEARVGKAVLAAADKQSKALGAQPRHG